MSSRSEHLPPRTVPGGYVISARSHLVDQHRAECERIFLPPRIAEGGTLEFRSGIFEATPPPRHPLRPKPKRSKAPEGRWIIDMRVRAPGNWAHFLNNHLPLFFHLSQETGRDWDKALLLVPGKVPGHLAKLADLFGLELLPTWDVVEGDGVSFEVTPWIGVRARRVAWGGMAKPQEILARTLAAADGRPLPKKFFLARRDTRRLENAAEIEAWLAARGFETIYAEDYPVPLQMRLFQEAEEIVAIHGAGLAPMLYCGPGHGPKKLIELQPVPIMTDVYRDMATQVGCTWIGVRGQIRPEYIKGLYDLETSFTSHVYDDFTIDPASLELAFDLIETEADPNPR